VELASVYAVAELERSKGGGIIIKQPEEKLSFIAQIGYPLWLFPNSDTALIFDAVNPPNFLMSYPEFPSSIAFIESLESCSKTKEEYFTFLLDHQSYFQQPTKEKQLSLKGLIIDEDFKKEFTLYRKEATETSNMTNLTVLNPILEESTISSMLSELSKLRLFFKEDADRLPECLRLLSKITSQYTTELEYAAKAAEDEVNAKIRANEELVNPQIAKLNSDYKHRINEVSRSYNDEIQSLTKHKEKTEKLIENNEEKIKQYQRQAQSQAIKNHASYEKRWKEKGNKTNKELGGLKKEQKILVTHEIPKWAYVQALMSRGDRRTSAFLMKALEFGGNWMSAMREVPLNPDFYVYRQRSREELFPWDFIDHGVAKDSLWHDYQRALQED